MLLLLYRSFPITKLLLLLLLLLSPTCALKLAATSSCYAAQSLYY
jgi:hypothetical protein